MEDIEPLLGSDYERFQRGGIDVIAFDTYGVHVESEGDGQIRAVTVFSPCRVTLQGIELLGRRISDVKRDLDVVGLSFKNVDAGLWSETLLVMLVEQDGIVDGVEIRRIPY